ncbi:BZ3500_MvSof-1268-A1-R1_Chr5-2g07763 [Microbotryum saponariae]|uniref:BZ3500_MvSof-1268-A1-R1_Chr5-2g07763 protein n=1 Tax=Microbotryum saponariae TaxID=289078 RepID=A0A2X0KGE6_9BASI|nr:BZ3500_MvSof-1268-A1-R1_Chr5-2g07763 [Microbotryum saponariae]SDA05632.1 BZ3501_MvSof-1269-A2-R1_Chr5-2g07585 [Microbotryum saponariae]
MASAHTPASLHLKHHPTSPAKPERQPHGTTSSAPASSDEFIRFAATMRLPLAPVWSADGAAGGETGSGGTEGVRQVLAGWVMRYLPPLQCVLLTFSPTPTFVHPTSTFPSHASPFPPVSSSTRSGLTLTSREESNEEDDLKPTNNLEDQDEQEEEEKVKFKVLPMISGTGFGLPIVHFTGVGWRPRVGQKIVGSPTLSTPSHVSLLLHNLFNATLPASHIPSDEWRFDPDYVVPAFIRDRQKMAFPTTSVTKAANEDAEEAERTEGGIEADAEGGEEKEEELAQEEEARLAMEEDEMYADRGWWVNVRTGEPMGGEKGSVEFTIVSLTIANSMITITGSLLSSPFSSKVPPQNPIIATYRSGLSNAADVMRRHTTEEHNRKRKEMAKELGEDDDESQSESDSEAEDGRRGERAVSMSPVDQVPRVKEEGVAGRVQEERKEKTEKKDKKGKKEKKEKKDKEEASKKEKKKRKKEE